MTRMLVLMVAVGCTTGCGMRKQHLIPAYGDAFDRSFAAQHDPRPEPARAITGLDSQEAAIVSATYRASLAPKGTQASGQQLLIVSPQAGDRQQAMPRPSVPRE